MKEVTHDLNHDFTVFFITVIYYMQYGPTMNGGVTTRPGAAVRYRTILRVAVNRQSSFGYGVLSMQDTPK